MKACIDKSTVLVTAIGTAAATSIIKELRNKGLYQIVGTDIYESFEVATSRDVDVFFKVPSVVENETIFLESILTICKKCNVKYYFPTIDEEVAILSASRYEFEARGVCLCIPNDKAIRLSHNKLQFGYWIETFFPSIYIKEIRSLDEAKRAEYPLFIKPSIGRASIGCKRVNSFNALISNLNENQIASSSIVQEYIIGDIVVADIIRNAITGQFKVVPRIELLRNSNGCGIAVKIIKDELLMHVCEEVSSALDLHGVINAEFFRVSDGYKIIEINPRLSAGVAFSCMAGANIVEDMIHIVNGERCSDDEIRYGSHFAKRYEPYEMALNDNA